jgi:hypothetical protein
LPRMHRSLRLIVQRCDVGNISLRTLIHGIDWLVQEANKGG